LWTTRLLARHACEHGPAQGHACLANLAQGTVCKILDQEAVKPHKVRYYLEQRDPDFAEMMAEVLCVYRQVTILKETAATAKKNRHCKAGTFDAIKLPATNNIENWFVAPASVEKGIGDIRVLQEHRARRDTTRRDMTENDGLKEPQQISLAGHDATRQDMTDRENQHPTITTQQDASRHSTTTDLGVYDHPYVKKLEDRCDKLESKYDAQVRRTEEIQLKAQQQLVELQRMKTIGQNQTLADFMLKAKEWILGPATPPENREVTDSQQS
jgi:hypothetical protein